MRDHDLTIRQVAGDCHAAAGTLYNYFPSKEALLFEVMMGDWQDCCAHMRADALGADDPLEAIRRTTAALYGFTSRYAPMWRNYASAKDSMGALHARHHQIIADISAAAGDTLERFSISGDTYLPEILAELILYASRTEDGFDRIAGVLSRILS